jgi:iron-only hydrogenase group A
MIVKIEVNNKIIKARKGETIMAALQANGIKIPSICSMRDYTPTGACRMCVVEIEGRHGLVPSCSQPVSEWMKIKTHSPRVIKSRKTIVELLLSNHPDDCLYCERNGNCELQTLAEELNVRERRIQGKKNKYKLDHSSPSLVRDPSKCILCGRCVRVCEEKLGVHAIEFINRGNRMIIGTACNKDINFSSCVNCGQCIMVCPTGALSEKDSLPELEDAIHNPDKMVVVQYAPSISVTLAEEFGIKPGKDVGGLINAALRKIGFDKIFLTAFAADMTVLELSRELQARKKQKNGMPLISSCCPAWIKYAEQWCEDLLPAVSTCKSPQQMLGSVLKTWYPEISSTDAGSIFSVAIAPCTAKKFEAQREEMTRKGLSDIDVVLTTRELAKLIRLYGIDMNMIEPAATDEPYGMRSTSGKLFGAAGGMTEALMRTLPWSIENKEASQIKFPELRGSKSRKEASLKIGKRVYNFLAISGLANAREVIEEVREGKCKYDFIEIMACPGGCINGGGQPIGADEQVVKTRMKALYNTDERETIKVSHKNPRLNELYASHISGPGAEKAASILHTSYSKRKVLL